MSFTPFEWKDGQEGGTPITAAQLNRMEQGIKGAHDDLAEHINNGGAHGATSSETANAIVRRDSSGRARFSDPQHEQDAATKRYVDQFDPANRFQLSGSVLDYDTRTEITSRVSLQEIPIVVPNGKKLVLKRVRWALTRSGGQATFAVYGHWVLPETHWRSSHWRGDEYVDFTLRSGGGGLEAMYAIVEKDDGHPVISVSWWLDLAIENE